MSASLAQIGEFSFILAELGVALNLLPKEGRDLILAGAIISILLNPLIFATVDWLTRRLDQEESQTGPAMAPEDLSSDVTVLTNHTILVGYGRVGSIVAAALQERGRPYLVVEAADSALSKMQDQRIETIIGNAVRPDVLRATNLAAAHDLVIAIPDAFEAGQIVQQARVTNPGIKIIARAHSDAEVEHLTHLGANIAIMGEREIARGMIERLFSV